MMPEKYYIVLHLATGTVWGLGNCAMDAIADATLEGCTDEILNSSFVGEVTQRMAVAINDYLENKTPINYKIKNNILDLRDIH